MNLMVQGGPAIFSLEDRAEYCANAVFLFLCMGIQKCFLGVGCCVWNKSTAVALISHTGEEFKLA